MASLVTSRNGFVLDNNWDLYNLRQSGGQVLRHFGGMGLSFQLSRLVFEGSYFVAVNGEGDRVFLVRCCDSFVSASFVIGDRATCVEVGEMDRTLVIGELTSGLYVGRFFGGAFISTLRKIKTKIMVKLSLLINVQNISFAYLK